jgi:hypothetical protein
MAAYVGTSEKSDPDPAEIVPDALASRKIGALALLGTKRIVHLGFQYLLNNLPDQRLEEVLLTSKHLFRIRFFALFCLRGICLSFLSAVNRKGERSVMPRSFLQNLQSKTITSADGRTELTSF